jgi:hypothetical protein
VRLLLGSILLVGCLAGCASPEQIAAQDDARCRAQHPLGTVEDWAECKRRLALARIIMAEGLMAASDSLAQGVQNAGNAYRDMPIQQQQTLHCNTVDTSSGTFPATSTTTCH